MHHNIIGLKGAFFSHYHSSLGSDTVFRDGGGFSVVLKCGVLLWYHLLSQESNATMNVTTEGMFH